MTEDTSPAQPEGGESTSRGSRNPTRGRRFRRPPRRPRGRPGFRAGQEPKEPTEKPAENESAGPTPEEVEADTLPSAPDVTTEEFNEPRGEADDVREEVETAVPSDLSERGDDSKPEAAEPSSDTQPASQRPPAPEPIRREHQQERRPPPRERFQPRGQGHNQQRPPQQPSQRYEPRPPVQPPPPPSVAKAIEEVKGIIEDLTEALDDMEQVLRILEDAEVQKNADEREIESLRRQLKMLHRREGGQPRHQPQGANQGQSGPRREEQEPDS
jgi:hypothetical protein